MIRFFINEIKDTFAQQNFKVLLDYFRKQVWDKGNFQFFEYTFNAAVTAAELPHKLSFIPKDVIQLSVSKPDGVAVTWHFDDFDRTNVVISTTGACTVRAFIGSYAEGQV